MGRLSLAWRILTSRDLASKVETLLLTPPAIAAPVPATPATPPAPKPPARSDAISLLSALQREGRMIDFLKESIDGYTDAQIGAAVRDIHRDCGAVLERQFAIRPVVEQPEGSPVSLAGKSVGTIRLSGNVGNNSASSGALIHHGWQATKCDVPVWTGDASSVRVIAPAEVEVK
ncbi:MAG: DUF2760 domain-containing protein [Planctomycetota bacterium]